MSKQQGKDIELWESRELGASLEHAQFVEDDEDQLLDKRLGLQSISIRLSKRMIDQYKMAAHVLGKGYQPLMRDALERAIKGYLKEAVKEIQEMMPEDVPDEEIGNAGVEERRKVA